MIHKYIFRDRHVVIDVNSGAVHMVDPVIYDALDFYEDKKCDTESLRKALVPKYGAEALEEACSDIEELIAADMLFSDDEVSTEIFEKKQPVIKAMCLHVAHDCNMNCAYCFGDKGAFEGIRCLLTPEMGKKALDFLMKNSGSRRNLEIDFFGGEPLMNFDVVKQIVEYARSQEKEHGKNFRFTITTNGLLLTDDKIDFINREMSNVVLSIDGRKEVNDRLRVRVDGTGCYDKIVPAYQKLVANRSKDKDYYARGTFTKYNLDFTDDVLHMADLGFDQLSIEPVVSDEKLDYSIKEADLPAVFQEYERLAKVLIDRKKQKKGINFFHFAIDLDQGPCAIKRLRGCGCGNEYIAVTPQGDIFPCHQFVGEDQWKMGNVLDGTFDTEKKKYFAKANVYSKEDCRNCWAKFYCSGGCNANNWQYEGNVLKSHKIACDLEKKRLECAIMMKAALADS